jgi:ferredoxin
MTYFVGSECVKCKYTDCVAVCPVDCFYEGKEILVIDPEECIDCGVCVPECPVNAIRSSDDLDKLDDLEKSEQMFWLEYNAKRAKVWKENSNLNITKIKSPLPEHDKYAKMTDKGQFIIGHQLCKEKY